MCVAAPLILAIEDDDALCAVYAALFAEEGYRCQTWSDDLVADPAAVARLAPDLVILDLVMRGQPSGWEFLAALHADPGTTTIPILVVTAADRLAKDWATAIRAWGCGLLLKPFDLDDFLAAVRDCMADDRDRLAS